MSDRLKFNILKNDFFNLIKDKELLHDYNYDDNGMLKGKRPYLLVLSLKYKGNIQDFVIPFRSNVSKKVDSKFYFALPRRKSTKEKHVHALHYQKMFPISKDFLEYSIYFESDEFKKYSKKIEKNIGIIVEEAQNFVSNYNKNDKDYSFTPDWDNIINKLKNNK